MAIDDLLIGFAVANLVTCLVPGPATLLALSHGARFGVRSAVSSSVGISIAAVIYASIAMSGLQAALAFSGTLFTVVRWLGAAYLVWMGFRLVRSGGIEGVEIAERPIDKPTDRACLRQGFLVGTSNPKAIAFFSAVFPQFLQPGQDPWNQYAAMLVLLVTTNMIVLLSYAASGQRLSAVLRRPRVSTWFSRVTGGLFIGAGTGLALSER